MDLGKLSSLLTLFWLILMLLFNINIVLNFQFNLFKRILASWANILFGYPNCFCLNINMIHGNFLSICLYMGKLGILSLRFTRFGYNSLSLRMEWFCGNKLSLSFNFAYFWTYSLHVSIYLLRLSVFGLHLIVSLI